MFEHIFSGEGLISLFMLTFMEIVLGIDNIVFISIISGKLPKEEQKKAREIGLFLAMIFRVILLFGITWVLKLNKPLFEINWPWFTGFFSIQNIIILAGGLFLLYKSVTEITHKVEGEEEGAKNVKSTLSVNSAIWQIAIINIVFSFDSILTAIGMVDLVPNYQGFINPGIIIMIIAVIISIGIMIAFAGPVIDFVNKHPSIQILALSFLLLIGIMLISEAAHLGHWVLLGNEIKPIAKGYLYFAIFFSLMVEYFNLKMDSSSKNKTATSPPTDSHEES